MQALFARKLSLFDVEKKKGLEYQQDPLPLPLELLDLNFGKLSCLRFLCFLQVLWISCVDAARNRISGSPPPPPPPPPVSYQLVVVWRPLVLLQIERASFDHSYCSY